MIKRETILAQNPWLTDVSVVAETTSTQLDAKDDLGIVLCSWDGDI